ncbi:MAG: transglycosylase SLT domain-containing protein [Elusimicrobia bacterium]|nr:transglycosylase SLT domain-containing protein [Elusimicrobiota bacterium]
MKGKLGWATVAVGLALCASPSFSATTALVKISVRIPEGTVVGDKLGPTEEFARVLLGSRVQGALIPSTSDQSATLRYEAAQWNQTAPAAKREEARAGLLKLWGNALTIESPDSQARPDPFQTVPGYLQPKKAETWKPAFKAMGLVDTPAFRSASFTQAYDNGRGSAASPLGAPVVLAAANLPNLPAQTAAPVARPFVPARLQPAPKAPETAPVPVAPQAEVRDMSPDPAQQPGGLYEGVIVPIADEYGVSPDVVRALIAAKANCGSADACDRNLMGLSAGVVRAYGYKTKDISDAAVNIRVGTRLLAQLLKQFDGDIHRALAAYQVGPAAVIKSRGIPNDPGVKNLLAAFEKAFRGTLPKRSVQAVAAPAQSLAKEVAAEIQEGALGLADLARGNPKVARYRPLIQKMAGLTGIDADLMEAMVMQENPWGDPRKTSSEGAVGLGQLMPQTAAMLGVKDSTDPAQNLKGMAKHLKYLLDKYGGNKVLAVAAYNAGEGRVDRVGRVPNIKETKTYVQRVMGFYADLTGAEVDLSPYMPSRSR